jgi:hypothetical protein
MDCHVSYAFSLAAAPGKFIGQVVSLHASEDPWALPERWCGAPLISSCSARRPSGAFVIWKFPDGRSTDDRSAASSMARRSDVRNRDCFVLIIHLQEQEKRLHGVWLSGSRRCMERECWRCAR